MCCFLTGSDHEEESAEDFFQRVRLDCRMTYQIFSKNLFTSKPKGHRFLPETEYSNLFRLM